MPILVVGGIFKLISLGLNFSASRNIATSSWQTIQGKKYFAVIANGIGSLFLTVGLVLGFTELLLN